LQHASSVAHSAPPLFDELPPPPPSPLLEGVLLELHAAAVTAATKTTGMAKSDRLSFMAGHHTRRFDRVKNLLGDLVTKACTFQRQRKPTVR
jgi:hypothetical protein